MLLCFVPQSKDERVGRECGTPQSAADRTGAAHARSDARVRQVQGRAEHEAGSATPVRDKPADARESARKFEKIPVKFCDEFVT